MAEVKGITADDLLMNSWCCADEWMGTADQLVFSGIIERAVLPGEPGNNKVCATYYRGEPVGKGKSSPHDEGYLRITRYGKQKFIVRKGVSVDEKQRRKTKEKLLEKHPDIDINSLAQPFFSLGEKVGVDSASGRGVGEVVNIRYDNANGDDYVGYVYKVEPSPSDEFYWFTEEALYKYEPKLAPVFMLPGSAPTPVQQPRRRGRLPKGIISFWDARYERRRRDEKITELREKLRGLHRRTSSYKELIFENQVELVEVKKQLQELLN